MLKIYYVKGILHVGSHLRRYSYPNFTTEETKAQRIYEDVYVIKGSKYQI